MMTPRPERPGREKKVVEEARLRGINSKWLPGAQALKGRNNKAQGAALGIKKGSKRRKQKVSNLQ